MACEWPHLRIDQVAEKVAMGPFGSSIKVSTFVPCGIPVISGQHLRGTRLEDSEYNFITPEHAERLKNANVYRGDVIFTHAGNIGQAAYIPPSSRYDRYVISQRQFFMRCNTALIRPSFVAYYFKTHEGQHKLLANSSPSGVPSIAQPVTYLRSIELPVPPLLIQDAIANILGALDDKIELNRKMNQTLEEMARAIFKSWFVDFDPVHAKAAVRSAHPGWTNEQVSRSACPNLKPEIAALFPDSFEPACRGGHDAGRDSELGKIPKGWEVDSLGNVADVNWGDTNVTKKSYVDEGYLAYSAKGPDGFLPYYDYDRTGVVLSAIGANSGFTWLAHGKWSCIKNTIRFWCTDQLLSTEYLFYATLGNHRWLLRGSAQPFISQADARNVQILKPGKNIAKLFGDKVCALHEKCNCAAGENVTLAALRDTAAQDHLRRVAGAGCGADRGEGSVMAFDPERHRRRSIRLHGYDYSQGGAYFVTVCAQNREYLFGEIADGEMRLNDAGKMVERWWYELMNKFPESETDEHIVMPNHFHGIVIIVGADLRVCPESGRTHRSAPTMGASLPRIMQWFKTMTTNEYIRGVKQYGWQTFVGRLWQRNYYEHIIRDGESLNKIREYIVNNPMQWALDRENLNIVRAGLKPARTKDEPWRI